jgi:class 3 adenylate cyclase
VRPWYKGALQTHGLFWSDTYIFFSDKKPGITVSYPVFSQNEQLLAVIAIDIKLEQISAFLAALKIGETGRAMIIEDDGKMVAYPELDRIVKGTGDTLQTVRLDELGDPVLTRAFNRFKIQGHGQRALVVDDRRYLNTVTSLRSTVGRDWSVMIIVPEEDYVGFLRANLNKVLLMIGGIVIFTAILAFMLVLHGLRTDRRVLGVLERQLELEAQSRAFSELASKTALWDPDDVESLKELTEIVAVTMAVRCVSVWGYDENQRIFTCEDSFDQGTNGHTGGTVLNIDDYPQLLQDLIKGEVISISDTAADPRTSALYRAYLGPLGYTSLLAIPVMPGGRLAGAVWFEHEETIRTWASEDISFGRAIASMLALRLSATRVQNGAAVPEPSVDRAGSLNEPVVFAGKETTLSMARPTGSEESAQPHQGRGRKISFSERLEQQGFSTQTTPADVYEDATVLVLRFTDSLALATHLAKDKSATVGDHLICHLEDLADAHRIDYWKIISDQIICAAGMQEDSKSHTHVIADLALVLQDKCSHLFADLDRPMDFKIGIDTGGLIGSPIGRRQKSYNIYGEALSAAAMLADHGVRGGIQVSETAYRRLQQDYLFKARGRYYLPKIGEITTFILTGRI